MVSLLGFSVKIMLVSHIVYLFLGKSLYKIKIIFSLIA